MNWTTIAIGLAAILYGVYTLYARRGKNRDGGERTERTERTGTASIMERTVHTATPLALSLGGLPGPRKDSSWPVCRSRFSTKS